MSLPDTEGLVAARAALKSSCERLTSSCPASCGHTSARKAAQQVTPTASRDHFKGVSETNWEINFLLGCHGEEIRRVEGPSGEGGPPLLTLSATISWGLRFATRRRIGISEASRQTTCIWSSRGTQST